MRQDPNACCPLHAVPLREGCVIISFGTYSFGDAFIQAQRHFFPKAGFFAWQSYAMQAENKIVCPVQYCSACRRAQLLWEKENSSVTWLPPTLEDAERTIHDHFGIERSVHSVPAEIHDLLRANKLLAAVKLLQQANPGVEIPRLRSHLRYLGYSAELEQALQAIRTSGPHLAYADER
ncbi:hypothetical protein [Massilia aquatica]|uniref:Uncharacterized protein n=1 Tax=Massilia aquatica TaxID=2609000 RepID=A0ABX0M050_9BURK|nr:hypothetical protein [Massilia aquatica]NHZ40514.1 hypothetical protein [Massilia aquatica]